MVDVRETLRRSVGGDAVAEERLGGAVYDELREIARRQFLGERAGHTLQPTAVVNEALMRMLGGKGSRDRGIKGSRGEREEEGGGGVDWESRTHFLAVAAREMRRVLIDHARGRDALKRGGGRAGRVTLSGCEGMVGAPALDALVFGEALERLHGVHERAARVVELRFFGGLRERAIGELLGVSERTVQGDWRYAKAWLRRELGREEEDSPRRAQRNTEGREGER